MCYLCDMRLLLVDGAFVSCRAAGNCFFVNDHSI